jgi:hypothetical protein
VPKRAAERERAAPLGGVEAEVGEVGDDGAVAPARVGRDEARHRGATAVGEGLAGGFVDAADRGEVVGQELVEPHVDRLRVRQQVTVGGAAAQQVLHPGRPVRTARVGIGVVDRHPLAVRDHRDHRGGDRHRVAMGGDEGGVGEDLEQRGDLLAVLG